jgi:hypothetical protein
MKWRWVWAAAVTLVMLAAPMFGQIGRRATRPQITPPDGPVWQVIRKSCSGCHGIDEYAFFALDRAGWRTLIDDKHRGWKVTISDSDTELLLDWLASKFGPDSTPFPRTYVPPEINTFFTDAEATTLLERACVSCHDMKRINESRFAPDRWRVILVAMRERGAVLSDEELERMVEWLGRVKGINPNQ